MSGFEFVVSGGSWLIQVLSHGILHFVALLQPWSRGVLVESTVKVSSFFSNWLVGVGFFTEFVIVFCSGRICVLGILVGVIGLNDFSAGSG